MKLNITLSGVRYKNVVNLAKAIIEAQEQIEEEDEASVVFKWNGWPHTLRVDGSMVHDDEGSHYTAMIIVYEWKSETEE